MKHITLGLLGAAALATTTFLLVRQQREIDKSQVLLPSQERRPPTISLERIRELGY
ncbi:MAG: hypothetical protein R3304_00455 [Longimicrobiales bacterium]|nr:hypothetical protein [Longimicrobiales bacterium]